MKLHPHRLGIIDICRRQCAFFISMHFLLFTAMVVACSDDPENIKTDTPDDTPSITIPDTEDKTPVISQAGGTATLSFTASKVWTVEITNMNRTPSWISVSPTSGGAGTATLTISVEPNDSYDERNAAITLRSGNTQTTITVTQKQLDALLVSSNKVELESVGGNFNLEVQSNVTVNYKIEEGADWLTSIDTKTRALSETNLAFHAEENDECTSRQATITLTGGNGLTEQVTIYQKGAAATLVLSQQDYVVANEGETLQVELKSNTQYAMQLPNVDWISEVKTRAISSYTHYLSVAANNSSEPRQAEVVFTDAGNDLRQVVTIYQIGTGALALAKKLYTLPYNESKLDITVLGDVTITISDDWIKQVTTRTSSTKTLQFVIEENNDYNNDREGNIILEDSNGQSQSIKIIQSRVGKGAIINTSYEVIMSWDVKGYVKDEEGNISYNPSLDMPADWYDASYQPYCLRTRTYSDGSCIRETFSDYGFIYSGPDFIVPISLSDKNEYDDYYYRDDHYFPNAYNMEETFIDNALTGTRHGRALEITGVSVKDLRIKQVEDSYIRYYWENDNRFLDKRSTPFNGQYDYYSLVGPNRVWLSPEQLQKFDTYFGHETTYNDLLSLTAKEMVNILGTGNWNNPYLGLPEGTYSFAWHHAYLLEVEGADIYDPLNLHIKPYHLGYATRITQSDGFFLQRNDQGDMIQIVRPENIGKEEYQVDIKVVSDDARKTVAVLSLNVKQNFEYENTQNGFPDTDDSYVTFEGEYPTFRFQSISKDTLVSYKYTGEEPFKVLQHYCYSPGFVSVPIEVNRDYIEDWYYGKYTGGSLTFDYEIRCDVGWIHDYLGNSYNFDHMSDDINGLDDARVDSDNPNGPLTQGLNLYFDPYYGDSPRVGYVTFKMKGSDYQETVRIMQLPSDKSSAYSISVPVTTPLKSVQQPVRWGQDFVEFSRMSYLHPTKVERKIVD